MKNSIFPWKTLAIATAALTILFIGGFLISGDQPVQSKQTQKVAAVASSYNPSGAAETEKIEPKEYPYIPTEKPQHTLHKKSINKSIAADTGKTPPNPEDITPIDEMVVIGMAEQADKATVASIREAHPKMGWSNFENYIKEKAVSPDGKSGIVKVAFTVNTDGTCDGFKVKTGLTDAADQKAIELIKNGPSWTGNADGQPKETIVSVDFH
jgi:hypothetical protein